MKELIAQIEQSAQEIARISMLPDLPSWVTEDAAIEAGKLLQLADRLRGMVEGKAA
jgi:hypothetical protein